MNSSSAHFEHPDDIAAAPAAVPEKLTYSVAEAAVLLGVSRPTIYRLIGRRVLIPIPGMRHKRLSKRQVRRLGEAGGCDDMLADGQSFEQGGSAMFDDRRSP
jgi:excisionase family DNA binding protein